MRHRLLFVLLVAGCALSACAPRIVRPWPKLGRAEDIRTKPGRYDGYSVSFSFDHVATDQGHRGDVVVKGLGRKPIVVREVTEHDSLARRVAPGLRIDSPMMMGPVVPSEPALLERRVEGLDYDFMMRQGWLFDRCSSSFSVYCETNGYYLYTASFQAVDALIAYLGRWLKEGDHADSLVITVVQHPGGPEDIKTRMGAYDGYTVDWCNRMQHFIVLTGQGPHAFAPPFEGAPEDVEKRGPPDDGGTGVLDGPGCNAPHAVQVEVSSYEEVDAAIIQWGRRLRDGGARGEVVIHVNIPSMVYEL